MVKRWNVVFVLFLTDLFTRGMLALKLSFAMGFARSGGVETRRAILVLKMLGAKLSSLQN